MSSPFRKRCDRCGEEFYPDKAERIFSVSYETLGYMDLEANRPEGKHVWRTLDLCSTCQHDLRTEFYYRGLMKHEC